jgi:hypothetical protein
MSSPTSGSNTPSDQTDLDMVSTGRSCCSSYSKCSSKPEARCSSSVRHRCRPCYCWTRDHREVFEGRSGPVPPGVSPAEPVECRGELRELFPEASEHAVFARVMNMQRIARQWRASCCPKLGYRSSEAGGMAWVVRNSSTSLRARRGRVAGVRRSPGSVPGLPRGLGDSARSPG